MNINYEDLITIIYKPTAQRRINQGLADVRRATKPKKDNLVNYDFKRSATFLTKIVKLPREREDILNNVFCKCCVTFLWKKI